MTEQEIIVPADPFDLDVSAVPESDRQIKAVPSGEYVFEIIGYEPATNPKNGNRGIKYNLRLVEALDEQDIEGIPVDRINFYYSFWVTQASAPVVIDIHRSLNRGVTGTIKEFPEQMVGVLVKGDLETITVDQEGNLLKWPFYRINKLEANN